MELLYTENSRTLYREDMEESSFRTLLVSTPESQAICNDPLIFGVDYTQKLKEAIRFLFVAMKKANLSAGEESRLLVLNILRGGLNFGLRDALGEAYGWNRHRSAFISSQRAYDDKEGWHITENRYQKIPLMEEIDLLFADVVATGVSLEHAVLKLIELTRESRKKIRQITFITIGGDRARDILKKADSLCRSIWPDYAGTTVVFVEGIFGVAEAGSPLHIALPGTDLLRSPAVLTPEFIASQQEAPSYALERCTIYDAGSRAYDVNEYLEDVKHYWTLVLGLARSGMRLEDYLKERFPEDARLLDSTWCTSASAEALAGIAEEHLKKLSV